MQDLVPNDWSDLVVKTTTLGQAAFKRPTLAIRNRIAQPAKRRLKEVFRRAMSDGKPPLHTIPWGKDHVLVATPFGTRLMVPVRDLTLAPELALSGTYDQPFIDFLARSLKPGMTFVDVGANVGLFTIVGASLVGSGGRVFSYECNPGLVNCIRMSIQMNWFNDRVVLIPKAAGRDSSPTTFWMSNQAAALGSTVPGNALVSIHDDTVETVVPTESLDQRLADVGFVDLLKIDVEGGEPAVLDGARQLFAAGKIGMLSLEFRDDALTDAAYADMAERLAALRRSGATFHVPGSRRAIPLDEVLVGCQFPQLICRFPNASIPPS
jgi:FkbM family methyltransferase